MKLKTRRKLKRLAREAAEAFEPTGAQKLRGQAGKQVREARIEKLAARLFKEACDVYSKLNHKEKARFRLRASIPEGQGTTIPDI